ncbi:MAG: HPF/RaiA family ribosome-associated protein [candidate division Zixibacteria bacterium]|nr:HPF/RaiA family ribosome-associated protein [candidate division Zixibacteria bacterium]
MQVPLELTFRDVTKTEDIENLVHQKVDALHRVCDHLTSCRVAIEKPQRDQRTGSPFRVRIDIHVPPGHEIIAKREPGESDTHAPLDSVIRDTFDAAQRQLKRLVERQQGEEKSHPEQEAVALVARLFPNEDYGFLQTVDGRDVYFHRNAVTNDDFDRLELGTGVHFVEVQGDEGPQASTVRIVDKPGARASE